MLFFRQTILFLLFFIGYSASSASNENFEQIFQHVKPNTTEETQRDAAIGVISRLLPNHVNLFVIEIDFNLPTNSFKILKTNSTESVNITASSGVSACRGFYYYLKYYCFVHISWEGTQLNMPSQLPNVNIEINSLSKFIYYQNVCTWSYSFVWWTSEDWRKHIDWMAMSGINLVLAPVQENVWTNMFKKIDMTTEEIDSHISGAGFLAWQRMGNIRGWGGPLTDSFKQSSSDLQIEIIKSVRSLGMVVALPAFAGHVPLAFKRLFPNSTFTSVQKWNKFPDEYCCPLYLDPNDSLFQCIGEWFLMIMIQEYGTDHIYFSDPFNEIEPKFAEEDYLRNSSKSIYKAMHAVDDNAVWLLQGWMFVKNPFWSDNLIEAFLTANPIGSMLILDLQSEQHPQYERTHSFYGQPFIWCMLHNFGGTLGMHGSLRIMNERVNEAQNMVNSTMIGFGITAEGINQNYALYEFALEMGWFRKQQNFTEWFTTYTTARYGQFNPSMLEAWLKLVDSVYDFNGLQQMRGKYTFNRRPSLRIKPWTWYNTSFVEEAWRLSLNASNDLSTSLLYQHDLVDITRQNLQNMADRLYLAIKKEFIKKDLEELQHLNTIFLDILLDIERILKTSPDFLLGKWLESAKNRADNENDRKLFELNAKYQITLWGPNGEIMDYANKQWSGVVSDFFHKRWSMFLYELERSIFTNSTFNERAVREKILQNIEKTFVLNNKLFSIIPEGNPVTISERLYAKYHSLSSYPEIPKETNNNISLHSDDPSIILVL